MGYWVTKLKNIPTHFDWYFFLVGDYRNHSMINDLFRDDFEILSNRIGENSALISQNRSLERDLQESFKDVRNGALGKMMKDLENRSPGLFITNKHPTLLNNFSRMYKDVKEHLPIEWDESKKKEFLNDFYIKNHRKNDLDPDATIIYIPFTSIEKAYSSTNTLIADLVSFSEGSNNDLIKKTSKTGHVIRRIIPSSIGLNIGIVAINYNL